MCDDDWIHGVWNIELVKIQLPDDIKIQADENLRVLSVYKGNNILKSFNIEQLFQAE